VLVLPETGPAAISPRGVPRGLKSQPRGTGPGSPAARPGQTATGGQSGANVPPGSVQYTPGGHSPATAAAPGRRVCHPTHTRPRSGPTASPDIVARGEPFRPGRIPRPHTRWRRSVVPVHGHCSQTHRCEEYKDTDDAHSHAERGAGANMPRPELHNHAKQQPGVQRDGMGGDQ
jgi:hypothetical protein